jgi:hypothetical protein
MPKFGHLIAQLNEEISKLKELFISIGKDPNEVDELIKGMSAAILEQAKQNNAKR